MSGTVLEKPVSLDAEDQGGRGRPLRIALATETWHPSVDGIVTRLTWTVRELHRRGHKVMVIAPRSRTQAIGSIDRLPADLQVNEVFSVGLPMIYGGKPWGLPLPAVSRHLEAFQPDVVHAVGPFVLGRPAVRHAVRNHLPLVCSYHTHIASYARFYGFGLAEQAILRSLRRLHQQADVNLAASTAAKHHLEAIGVADVNVWEGGVNLNLFHPLRGSTGMRKRITRGHDDRIVVVYVGRLAAEKGIDRLLPLLHARSDVHLVLVGDGPHRLALEELFRGKNVTFMGLLSQPKVGEVLASSDVFAFPSTTDTLGLVVLEAMASGLPVLLADSQSNRDLISGTSGGVIFDPAQPFEIILALDALLAIGQTRSDLAAAARRRFPTWSQSTEQLLGWYRAVIRHRQARRLAA
ncbi:MAG TPA: glycosyltransferase family 1 protein [Candidatus Solibacter sp.]|jgi:glycosyltransferase involved in cell wall biosynthesis|nr:glycosyltransferase family 1 protein [Candidatus Solibacter sp.]